MADFPVPGVVERNVVKPPNETLKGDRRENGFLPLTESHGAVANANHGDRRGGSEDLAGTASPIVPPNHRFDVGMAKMPQPNSAVTPGPGSIPVRTGSGMPVPEMRAPK
jgi:hypothetical protein